MVGALSSSKGWRQRVVKSPSPSSRSSLLTVPEHSAPLLCILIASTLKLNSHIKRSVIPENFLLLTFVTKSFILYVAGVNAQLWRKIICLNSFPDSIHKKCLPKEFSRDIWNGWLKKSAKSNYNRDIRQKKKNKMKTPLLTASLSEFTFNSNNLFLSYLLW